MAHCRLGPGANSFGGSSQTPRTPSPVDPEHDLLSAMQRWREEGIPPGASHDSASRDLIVAGEIIATGYKGNDIANGTALTRPLCTVCRGAHAIVLTTQWPNMLKYGGQGDLSAASSFYCQ